MSKSNSDSCKKWPIKAYKDLSFLNSSSARNIRVLCEMTEPGLRFAEEHIVDTIVMFGSARIVPEEIAKKKLQEVQAGIKDIHHPSDEEASALKLAKNTVKAAAYYTMAAELAHELTKWSLSLSPGDQHRFIICSGGGPGIMEAANLGAHNAGGKSVGLGISLPFEQRINPYVTNRLQFEFHYFFVRKYWFILLAKALIAFPGGFGTMDELFELLTLVQTKKVNHAPPIVLFGKEFWENLFNFELLIEWGTIVPEDLKLFKIVDTVGEAKDYIIEQLTQRFL